MTAFDQLKKNRSKSLEKLNEQLSKLSTPKNQDDLDYWKPERGADGNGFAIIRFLPAPAGEDVPFVQIFDHGFQGPTGQWYIEKSLTTIGKDDPVGEYNRKLWSTGLESDKEIARKQKRRLKYVSNIYIIKDSAHPENEGQVKKFAYGKKIFDKLNDMMNPQFEDEDPVNIFDLWDGANFRLKIRMFEGYPNYDKSEFDKPSPLFDDDEKLEEVYNKCHSLKDLLDEKHYKTYEELEAKLNRVLGLTPTSTTKVKSAPSSTFEEDEEDESLSVKNNMKEKSAPSMKEETNEDEDDDMAFFKKFAEEE
jgi:hypothetical protein